MWTIDFEASGLSQRSYPIEVGITNGSTEYQAYIQRLAHWKHWDNKAQAVHGISTDTLRAQGKPPQEVAQELNALLAGQTVFCDSLRWDDFWNTILFVETGVKCQFQLRDITSYLDDEHIAPDIMLARRDALMQSGKYRLHSALDDARMLYQAAINA